MTLPHILGLCYSVIAAIHVIWTVSAVVRAFKANKPLSWPVPNRWVLALYVLSLTCLFIDFARARLQVGTDIVGDEWRLVLVTFVLLTSLVTFWRWLSGSLLNYGEKNK